MMPAALGRRRDGWTLPGLAVAICMLAPGCGSRGPRRVIVLGLDGVDPRAVDLLMSEGRLPNFARLRREGAYGRSNSTPPLLSPVIWTTIATGKTPDLHGIGHFTAVDEASGETLPVTSDMRRVKALWNVASERGKKPAVVGWWATWPAEDVNGDIVSDHLCYHFLFAQAAGGATDSSRLTHPSALLQRVAPLVRRPADVTPQEAASYISVAPAELARPFTFEDEVSHFKWALATADTYRRIGLSLWKEDHPDLLMVYIEATDSVSHLFGHLFRSPGLSGQLREQQDRFGKAVERIYEYADATIGEYLAAMDGNTTLIVLSDHGFDLGAVPDDPSKERDMRRVSEKFHNPQGILYLYGAGVKRGARLQEPRPVDVAPTVLSLLGLPVARDMPGRRLAEALSFTPAGGTVATFETGATSPPGRAADSAADPQILERLRSLGYLGGGGSPPAGAPAATPSAKMRSPTGDRNIAGIHFEAGRYEEAAKIYRRLTEESPEDASLHASLAGALGALGRYDEAARHLDIAIRLQPLNVEAYHNRAVLRERQGKRDAAIEDYRRAVRYDSRYEPSRQALIRLVGSAEVDAPRNEPERQAYALAQAAAEAARHGDYATASHKLDEAERLAPQYVLIQQYRSNVGYLSGDLDGAIAALKRALRVQPDNELFKANLKRLTEQRRQRPARR